MIWVVVVVLVIVGVRVRESPTCARDETQRGVEQRKFKDWVLSCSAPSREGVPEQTQVDREWLDTNGTDVDDI